MRGLLTLVAVMSVLIVAGVAVIGVTVVHRLSRVPVPAGAPTNATLDEPAGTQIVGVAGLGDRLAVALHGGGPDRIVFVGASGALSGVLRITH